MIRTERLDLVPATLALIRAALSIGVLEELGFALIGEGSEPGVIRYRREQAR